jgi:phosphohistidine phosphatase
VKRLLLLRHAKSSWSDQAMDDHERPLTSRGRKAADRIGEYLRSNELLPDLVLCSSAVRARETLGRILPFLGSDLTVRVEDELYGASVDQLLARLREVPPDVGSTMMVGHNPGIEELARTALDPARSRAPLDAGIPTAGLAAIDFRVRAWTRVGPGSGTLAAFVTPGEL